MIGLESIGNMSAVSAVLEENLIKKNKLVTQEDIIDAVTLSRIGPGATTANAVAYLGNKIAGFWGGALATFCYTVAPMIVIIVIYGFIEHLLEFNFVASALKGCLVYICVIFTRSTVDMGKSVLVYWFDIVVFLVALIISFIFDISCVWIIIGSIVVGGVKVFLKSKKYFLLN